MRTRTATLNKILIRDGEEQDLPVTVTVTWKYDQGDYIEPYHRHNGHGRGWYCEAITAEDQDGRPVQLTEKEETSFQEETHPNHYSYGE